MIASLTSLSARRAWIEMPKELNRPPPLTVALRKESVDRNFATMQIVIIVVVALRKESVDRNSAGREFDTEERRSLSARRAWIEIL